MRAHVSRIAILISLGLAPASAAMAQTALTEPPAAQSAEPVIVTGQRGATARARAEERLSDTLVNIVSADDAGQFGDQNTAEALQRLPGVNIDRNEGEGRTVSVRGLPSSFTQVTINGVRVGTSEAGDTSVALDVIPADQLASLALSKTYTPDMDGDTIGGAIDLRGASAFSQRRNLTTLSVEGSLNDYSGTWNPKVSASLTRRIAGDTIGIALSLNYYDRAVEGDDLRAEDDVGLLVRTVGTDNFLYPGEVNQRFEIGQRERLGGSLNLEYRPTDAAHYFLRGQYNVLKDNDTRVQNLWQLERATGSEVLTINQTQGEFRDVRVRHQIFFQPTEDTLSSISLGGRNDFGATDELTWQVDFSRSNWVQDDGIRGRFEIDDVIVSASWAQDEAAILGVRRDGTRPDPASPAAYVFNNLLFIEEERIDDIFSAQANYRRELTWGNLPGFIQTGLKFRDREKTADKIEFQGDPRTVGIARSYANTATFTVNTRMRGMNPMPDLDVSRALFTQARDSLLALPSFQRRDNSVASDYDINEAVSAFYLMGGVDLSENLKIIGGLRLESTSFSSAGNYFAANGSGLGPSNGPAIIIPLGAVTNDYVNALPSITLRYEPTDSVVMRASYGRAIKRPDFEEARNLLALNLDNNTLVAGNPNLNPLVADQFDASVAWYPSSNSVLQLTVFHKSMTDFFIDLSSATLAGTPIVLPQGQNPTIMRVNTTVNGDEAQVSGAELSFNQNFTMLPGLLSGLFVEGNVTWATSEAAVSQRPGETFAFPGQADLSGNLSIGWENEAVSLRASASHTGERLQGLGDATTPFEDRYRAAYTQLDVNLRWNVTDVFQIYADGINLNEAKETRFYRGSGYGGFYERVQDFGATYQLGVRAKF